jgi:hypothetical protein
MKITLAKAMKLKNRLAGRLNEVTEQITTYNCQIKGMNETVNVESLLKDRGQLQAALVEVKSLIAQANREIQRDIFTLGEWKSELTMYQSLNTQDGTQPHYQGTNITYVATIKQDQAKKKIRELEKLIDQTQDKLDGFNAETRIDVPGSVLDLVT